MESELVTNAIADAARRLPAAAPGHGIDENVTFEDVFQPTPTLSWSSYVVETLTPYGG